MKGNKEKMITDWDNDFIIQLSRLPKNIVSMKTA